MGRNINCHYFCEYYRCSNLKMRKPFQIFATLCIERIPGKICSRAIRTPRPKRPTVAPPKNIKE